MKKFICILLLFLPFLCKSSGSIEPPFQLVNSGKILQEGIKLHDEKKYKEAIEKYLQVDYNDTNYTLVLSELALSYLSSGDSIKAIETCKSGLALDPENKLAFYLVLGNAYSMADSLEKAIETYTKGAGLYPWVNKFWFEMGVAYARKGNDTAAVRCYEKSIRMNPLHASSHLQLAVVAARNGKFTHSLLAYQMFLLLDNKSNRSLGALVNIESIVKGELKLDESKLMNITGDQDDFSEIDEIIRSKSALSEKYKTSVKLKYTTVIKTMQAVLEKLEYNAQDKGFFNKHMFHFLRRYGRKGILME